MKFHLNYLVIFLFLISCEKENINLEKDITYNFEEDIRLDPLLISELRSIAVDTLKLESCQLVLDVLLNRDFSLPIVPGGRPLRSINYLINIDSMRIPDNINLVKQFVIKNDSIWISDYDNNENHVAPDFILERFTSKGPKWGPGIYLDVISQIHDTITNKDYFLIKDHVNVEESG